MTRGGAARWAAWSALALAALAWSSYLMRIEDGWLPLAVTSLLAVVFCLYRLHRTRSRQSAGARGSLVGPVGLFLCAAAAYGLTTFVWLTGTRMGVGLWRVLDAPISAANLVAVGPLQAGDARQFIHSTYCFPHSEAVERRHYVQLGTIAYTGLFYVPVFGALMTAA